MGKNQELISIPIEFAKDITAKAFVIKQTLGETPEIVLPKSLCSYKHNQGGNNFTLTIPKWLAFKNNLVAEELY